MSLVGVRMHGVGLVGQVILIVEDERGPFVHQLQAALERMGTETMLAHTPARARDHASRFDFSVACRWRNSLS
jgi:ActR/RegA family two-component response regulator